MRTSCRASTVGPLSESAIAEYAGVPKRFVKFADATVHPYPVCMSLASGQASNVAHFSESTLARY